MYICEFCKKEFKTVQGYNGHKTLAHKKHKKKCDKCEREISVGAAFKRHFKVCAGKIFCKNCNKELKERKLFVIENVILNG